MRRRAIVWALLAGIALVLAGHQSVWADDRVWSALVLATNESPAKPMPQDLESFGDDLRKIFGYNSFYILGEKRKRVVEGTEEWLISSKAVFLKLTAVNKNMASYELKLDLYANKSLALTSRVKLAREDPLYIRGPQWGNGQLIYILQIQ